MGRKLDSINSGGSRVCRGLGLKISSGPHHPAFIIVLQILWNIQGFISISNGHSRHFKINGI